MMVFSIDMSPWMRLVDIPLRQKQNDVEVMEAYGPSDTQEDHGRSDSG